MASMNGIAAASLGRSRSGIFRSAGTALASALRTSRRCTPIFRATARIVPAPCSYSRRICSYSSTLTLLFSKPRLLPGSHARNKIHGLRFTGGAKSEHRKGPVQSSEIKEAGADVSEVARYVCQGVRQGIWAEASFVAKFLEIINSVLFRSDPDRCLRGGVAGPLPQFV